MENKAPSRKAAFLVLLVFLLGIAIGGLADHFWGGRVWRVHAGPRGRDRIVSQLTRDLDLSPAQQKQLAAIIDDTRARFQALREPLRPQEDAIRQQGRDRIRAILTPEQLPKFEESLHRIDEERKKSQERQ
jgi:Spy/CpxP family protein refolding chaperone